MIPIDSPPLPRYRALFWDGTSVAMADRFDDLLKAETLARDVSCSCPLTPVEVWDVLLVCPMAWYQAGKLGWHR